MINVEEIKVRITEFLAQKGPALPIHLSREISLSPMFSSAILAELANEKKVKISNMKIGSSPLYFLPGDEQKLESFAESNFSGFEKSAFLKLKQNKFLEDEKQESAIRVALRSIRDFAFPFKFQGKIFWKYSFIPDEEIEKILFAHKMPAGHEKAEVLEKQVLEKQIPEKREIGGEEDKKEISLDKKEIEPIFDKKERRLRKKPAKKKKSPAFLEKVKLFLEKEGIRIISTESSDKAKVSARIEVNSRQYFLTAYNKKKVTERDILKAYKKASEFSLPSYILATGEQAKKISELVDACKSLFKIGKIEITENNNLFKA